MEFKTFHLQIKNVISNKKENEQKYIVGYTVRGLVNKINQKNM